MEALSAVNLLAADGIAERIQCPDGTGPDCPYRVVSQDGGGWVAVCGNHPPQCRDVRLSDEDAVLHRLVPDRLAQHLKSMLGLVGQSGEVPEVPGVLRLGVFKPVPDVRTPVFLICRAGSAAFSSAVRQIELLEPNSTPAICALTDNAVNGTTDVYLKGRGIPLLVMSDLFGISHEGDLTLLAPIESFHGALRGAGATRSSDRNCVAEVFEGGNWRGVSQQEYDRMKERLRLVDVGVDEIDQKVYHSGSEFTASKSMAPGLWSLLRYALEHRYPFDPSAEGPQMDQDSADQAFRRMRRAVDIGRGRNWHLFHEERRDGARCYVFRPISGATYLFIFHIQPEIASN